MGKSSARVRPGPGERQHAGGRNIAEDLEHGEEGAEAGVGDGLHDLGDAVLIGVPRKDALKLEQPALAVHAVPLEDFVEGVEERLVVDDGADGFGALLVVVGGVEEANGVLVEREFGELDGKGRASAPCFA